jgi:hypothetical protein
MRKTRMTKPRTAKSAPKTSPKKKVSASRSAPVAATTAAIPEPATPATRPQPTVGRPKIREDALLSLSTMDPASVPGCHAMFRYGYETMTTLKKPITFVDLVARIDADAEYHRRSQQEVRGHVRQLVSKLRKWGLLVAVNPEAPTKPKRTDTTTERRTATMPAPVVKADERSRRARTVA